jgi:23S rRNA (cytosine1962-C5)-methyltransferase
MRCRVAELVVTPVVMAGAAWADYGLIDSGDGRKLERYGPHRFIRPDTQALWHPRLERWASDGEFVPGSDEDGGGRWQFARPVPQDGWPLEWNGVRFTAQCTPFRHLGFFPDMAPVWDWMGAQLSPREGRDPGRSASSPEAPASAGAQSCLNLFGYTGVGTLALSQYGPVTHVDASKKSVAQARANAELAGMADRPVRWIVDDAAKFTAREGRRGKRYDGIILDPPKFGRGPEGEVWRLEEHLPGLIEDCRRLLDADSRFLFLTVYAVRMSSLALAGLLSDVFADLPGSIEHGDLAMREEGQGGRLLPTAIFARWSNPG